MKIKTTRMRRYLIGPELKEIMYDAGYLANALYQTIAPRSTGRMAESAVVDVEIQRPYEKGGPRWVATLSVEAPYGVPVEYGHKTRKPTKDGRVTHGRPTAPARALQRTVQAIRM